MQFHRALNEVFRSWTHVAVMRALQDTTVGFTGNQVAGEARMHPRSAFKALGRSKCWVWFTADVAGEITCSR